MSMVSTGLADLFFRRLVLQSPGVVQPVGDFDEDDPDVPGHGHEHLPQIFHLLLFRGGILHPGQLGDALDQHGHGPAKVLCDLIEGRVGILNAVVEQRAQDGVGVQTDLCYNFRNRQRMDDIGRAVLPLLIGVFLFRRIPRPR